jgi:hypothetical protein
LLAAASDAGLIDFTKQDFTAEGLALAWSFLGLPGRSPKFRQICFQCRGDIRKEYVQPNGRRRYCAPCAVVAGFISADEVACEEFLESRER